MKYLTTKEVAAALGVSPEQVRMYGKLGYLTPVTRSGETGRAQRQYFDPLEVEAFNRGGAPAAKAYRESKAPAGKARKPRRVGA